VLVLMSPYLTYNTSNLATTSSFHTISNSLFAINLTLDIIESDTVSVVISTILSK